MTSGEVPAKPDGGEFRASWPVLLAATLGSAAGLTSLPFYTLGTFIGPLQAEFAWGRGDIASSYLYTTLVLAIMAPLLGLLADRVGVRIVTLVSIPLFAGSLFLLSRFSGSLMTFHLIFALAALVGGGATPVNYTRAVNACFRQSRGLALGISLAGIGVAAVVLPMLLAEVNARHGWRAGYLLLAVLALVPWPFVLLALPRGERRDAALAAGSSVEALRSGLFWVMALAFCAVAVAVSALIVHMTPLLRDAGLDAMAAARTTSVIGIGVLVGRILAGYVVDRFFAPYVAAVMFAAAAGGCALLALGGVAMAPVAALMIGLSLGAEVDLMAYLTARYFGMNRYAFLYGIIYALFSLGGAIGPALAGVSFDATGGYAAVLWGVILLLLAAAVALGRLPRFGQVPLTSEAIGGIVPAHGTAD
ncbi:MFS transporter [Roseomonas elaeocarpi]|uniref:MFS transporter n=1 Tax=Roseomonas elaeocarpi TaxID=907779 RepID=A0ABV6JS29_9PROT